MSEIPRRNELVPSRLAILLEEIATREQALKTLVRAAVTLNKSTARG